MQLCQLPASDNKRARNVVVALHALLCTTPSNLSTSLCPPPPSHLPQRQPVRAACGLSSRRFSPSRAPTCEKMSVGGCACPGECSPSFSLSLLLPSSSVRSTRACCQSNDLCKSAAKLPTASCACVRACVYCYSTRPETRLWTGVGGFSHF